MNEQWTNDIRRKLADFEQPAPDLQWDVIDEAVRAQQPLRRPRHAALWPRLSAAAALAALLAGSAVYLSRLHDNDTVATTTRTTPKGKGKTQPVSGTQPAPAISTPSDEPSSAERLVASVRRIFTPTLPMDEAPLLAAATPTEQGLTTPTEQADDQARTLTEQPATASESGAPLPPFRATSQQPSHYGSSTATRPQHTTASTATRLSGLTAKAYVSGQLGSTASATPMMLAASSLNNYDTPTQGDETMGYIPTLGTTAPSERTHHHQPLRLGLSLRYRINDRWSVEGGLSYSHHSTDITEDGGSVTRQTDQQLNFVGIPVSVSYALWSGRHVSVYASAGGEAERMVSGKRTTQARANGLQLPLEEEKVKVTRPYFSVNAAVGAEVKLGQTVSVYAEPGVAYHFDNGATLPTIYADKPLNLNLSLGVRFSLR